MRCTFAGIVVESKHNLKICQKLLIQKNVIEVSESRSRNIGIHKEEIHVQNVEIAEKRFNKVVVAFEAKS